jgi:hypothetical protein
MRDEEVDGFVCPQCLRKVCYCEGAADAKAELCDWCAVETMYEFAEKYARHLLESPEERWEKGRQHHWESMSIMEFLCADDRLDFKMGGDGDNGEELMHVLDVYFEVRDMRRRFKK